PHISTLSLHDALPIFREAAGIEEIFRRDEVLQLALETFGDAPRVRIEQHGDLLAMPCGEPLDVSHRTVLHSKHEAGPRCVALRQDRKSTRLNSSHDQI